MQLSNLFWKPFAWFVSREPVATWLIARASKTKYFDLPGYMERNWLFNGYPPEAEELKKYKWLPSIRIHHILREDHGRDLHNHPWSARTIILKGWYTENRLREIEYSPYHEVCDYDVRKKGDTATLSTDDFHSIHQVSEGGVWTFFIIYGKQQEWGFLQDGKFIPHKQYEKAP